MKPRTRTPRLAQNLPLPAFATMAFVLAAAMLSACSDSSSSSATQTPPDPSLSVALASPCNENGNSAVAQVLGDGRVVLPLRATLANVTLNARGRCGSLGDCGHLRVDGGSGDKILQLRAMSAYLEVPLHQLETPFGSHQLTISLVGDDDEPLVNLQGQAQTQTLTVTALDPTAGGCGAATGGETNE